MPRWISALISCMSCFVIVAGGCLSTAMVATGQTGMPTRAVTVFAIVTGMVAAARNLKAIYEPPPDVKP